MIVSEKNYDFESFLSVILEEVIKTDITMQDRQLDAWKYFADYKPRGEYINDDIDKGWEQQRYLTINEVKFKFNVRLVPDGFFKRLKQGLRYILGKYNPQAFYKSDFEITKTSNPDSIEVTITIKQEEKGKMKITYEPDGELTKKIFMNSPFLQKQN
jgi:hypothetical protein